MTETELPPLRWALQEQREKVAARLQDAFVAGYLEEDELDLRLDRALNANDTDGLHKVLEGLPATYLEGFQAPVPATQALVRRDAPADPATDGALVAVSRQNRTLVRLIGDTRRTLVLGECAGLKCLSVIGDIRIKLTAPDGILPGETRITFLNLIGEIRLDVPPGVRVVNESVVLIGDLRDAAADDPNAVHTVFLRGLSLIGEVTVRVREG